MLTIQALYLLVPNVKTSFVGYLSFGFVFWAHAMLVAGMQV